MNSCRPTTSTSVKILTVSDLHRVRRHYENLLRAVDLHRPSVVALVGDFLDAGGENPDQLTTEECAKSLSRLPPAKLICVRGNHEAGNWWGFVRAWPQEERRLTALYGDAFVHGPLVVVGFPSLLGDDSAYVVSLALLGNKEGSLVIREPLPAETGSWLPALMRRHGIAARTLWLLHEPPRGTPLSKSEGPLAGHWQWVEAIERFSPWLTVSGHYHATPIRSNGWHCRIGRTVCVNVGQSDSGKLHYCLIEATFAKSSACLPAVMKVTAFPWNETIWLPLPEA